MKTGCPFSLHTEVGSLVAFREGFPVLVMSQWSLGGSKMVSSAKWELSGRRNLCLIKTKKESTMQLDLVIRYGGRGWRTWVGVHQET